MTTARDKRRYNDDRARIFGPDGRAVAFVCECDDPGCALTVVLTASAFAAQRPGAVLHETHPRPAPAQLLDASAAPGEATAS